MNAPDVLLFADSERDADMLYAVGTFVPDPFVYARLKGQHLVVVNDLELARLRRAAPHCRVMGVSQFQRHLPGRRRKLQIARVVRILLREHGVRRVTVPHGFPHGLARELRRLKVKIRPCDDALFPERQTKSADEVKKISAALMMAEVGLAEGIQALKHARIGKNRELVYHGVPLTAEKVQSIINVAVIQAGGIAGHTIVAGGRQACEPHECGHGRLRAHEPIVLDVFPRSRKTGYCGDITRTVVRGRASEGVRRLYHTVARAQDVAFASLRDGRPASEVHDTVVEYFAGEGYRTTRGNGWMEGFIHSTGHGLGLEVHEPPRLAHQTDEVLVSGNVVTLEPGLYYRELGGVRIEDVALLERKGPRNLTRFEKVLEL